MDQKISELYDQFRQGRLERREFIRKLALFTGGTAAATGIAAMLDDQSAYAAALDLDQPDVLSEFITYPGETGR